MKNHINNPRELIYAHRYWRLLEMVPGLLTWGALFGVVIGSYYFTTITANLIITYTFIWVYRSFYFIYHLGKSFSFSNRANQVCWSALNSYIEHPEKLKKVIKEKQFHIDPVVFKQSSRNKPLEPILLAKINELQKLHQYLKPSEVIHCVTIPTYKEPLEVIRASVKSYADSNYDTKKIILILSFEESQQQEAQTIGQAIGAEFGSCFREYIYTVHPKNLPNEYRGRAANATWGAKVLKQYLDFHGISYSHLILSSFDADTVVSPEYFNELTFRYCITKNRVEVGYQPVPFYHNNIWEVPIFNRLVAISCSFWQMSVSLRYDENKSFSSRAMSFQSVLDFNYWDTRVVQDDSRQYWTAFFVYNGRHYIENIYSPIYMDAVQDEGLWANFSSQYLQLRRWAWGASDFPFIVLNLLNNRQITWRRKLYEIFHFLESIFFWATGPILLLLAGYIPSAINASFRNTVLSYNLPKIMSDLMNIASIGIIVGIFITLKVLPIQKKDPLIRKLSLVLQWLLVPLISITLSSFPAIDAQTRLLLNKRLDFNVTIKKR